MKSNAFLTKLGRIVPAKLAEKHDYIGINAGKLSKEINKVLVCLDFDYEVFDIAKQYRPDIIISHHPFIYGKKAEVFYLWHYKRDLYDKVLAENMCVYAMHTNFDACNGGMNDVAASMLGLKDIYTPNEEKMMRIGYLEQEMSREDFANYVKKTFNLDYALLLPYGNEMIRKVGLILGGGSGYYKLAKAEGCDIYISGDAPHHVRRNVVNDSYNYLDVPHEIERIFVPRMKEIINSIDANIEVLTVDHEVLPKVI